MAVPRGITCCRSLFRRARNRLVMYGIMHGMQVSDARRASACSSSRRCPRNSVMISRPVQAAIGFSTKLPGASLNSPVSPQHVDALGLAEEMRLMRHDDRHQPVRLRECDQTAFAENIGGQVANPLEHSRALAPRYPRYGHGD